MSIGSGIVIGAIWICCTVAVAFAGVDASIFAMAFLATLFLS